MKNLKATAALPLTLLALLRCSGDAQGDAGEVLSGISSSKALSAVTAQEAARGCQQMKDAIAAHFSRSSARLGLCTVLGLALSPDESTCTSQRDVCLKDKSGEAASLVDTSLAFECSDTNTDGWQGCAATVGEMEACLNDMLAAFDTVLNSSTCADASKVQPSYTEDCAPPPLDAVTGMIAINPSTGQPYPDHRSDCEAAPSTPTGPATPKSCEALQTQCPELELFTSD